MIGSGYSVTTTKRIVPAAPEFTAAKTSSSRRGRSASSMDVRLVRMGSISQNVAGWRQAFTLEEYPISLPSIVSVRASIGLPPERDFIVANALAEPTTD